MQAHHRQELETLSDACFTYLVSHPDDLSRFMGIAGYDSASLKNALGTESLAFGMLDYFATNEAALTAMCESAGIPVDRFMGFWRHLNYAD